MRPPAARIKLNAGRRSPGPRHCWRPWLASRIHQMALDAIAPGLRCSKLKGKLCGCVCVWGGGGAQLQEGALIGALDGGGGVSLSHFEFKKCPLSLKWPCPMSALRCSHVPCRI